MRTVRDNYYIITGHTYEEYLKKYRHGIGKGNLLSFSEEEVKYLKKKKHYWEVIGPDGKTLYCQVPKVKAKHIIIPSVIAVLIAGGVVGGLYLPKLLGGFNGKVTEEEWKQSFSYLTDIGYDASSSNRAAELNYKATGDIYVGYNTKGLYEGVGTELVVVKNPFGEYETARLRTGQGEEYQNYSFYRYKNLPLVKDGSGNISSTTCLIHDTFDIAFESIYNGQDSFNFNSTNKYYTYDSEGITHEDLFKTLVCQITFNKDKKIDYLNLRYVLNKPEIVGIGCDGICVNFDLKFTYGGQSITGWTESSKCEEVYSAHYIETTEANIKNDIAVLGENTQFMENESYLINVNFETLKTKFNPKKYSFYLYEKTGFNKIYNWTNFIEVYYNGQKVKRVVGEESAESYYYNFIVADIQGITLNFIPDENSTITLKFGVRIPGVQPAAGDYKIYIE